MLHAEKKQLERRYELTECKNGRQQIIPFVFVLISLTSLVHTRKIERIWAVKRG